MSSDNAEKNYREILESKDQEIAALQLTIEAMQTIDKDKDLMIKELKEEISAKDLRIKKFQDRDVILLDFIKEARKKFEPAVQRQLNHQKVEDSHDSDFLNQGFMEETFAGRT